jgi:GTPase
MDKLGNHVHLTLPPEEDEGDVEYKWNLAKMNAYKHNKITSQMRWRVQEASENQSALYILGVHDNGQLTGLCRDDLTNTYVNLMDCASQVGLYTCLRLFKKIRGTESYWAILQVFDHPLKKRDVHSDYDLPQIPHHEIPDYLMNSV